MSTNTTIDEVHTLTLYPDYFRAFAKAYMAARTPTGCPVYQDFILEEAVTPCLTTLTILDLREHETARYRFCGSEVVAHTGMDLTGLDLLDLVPAEGRGGLYTDIKAMLARPCGNFSQHLDVFGSGKSVRSESLSLPLSSKSDTPAVFLATLHASEWTFLPDAKREGMLGEGDVRIGAEWIQALFVDTGAGTPGLTGLQLEPPDFKT